MAGEGHRCMTGEPDHHRTIAQSGSSRALVVNRLPPDRKARKHGSLYRDRGEIQSIMYRSES
jgi:hypothetical protein